MPPQVRLRVEVDGTVVVDVDDPVLMVAVGNGTSVGGGAELTPEADPEDGAVDVMISRSVGPMAKFGYAVGVARGRHHERDDVTYLRASEVTVSGESFYCAADGEITGPERRRYWQVVPAAYSMVASRPILRSEPAAAYGLDAGLEAGVDPELGHHRGDPSPDGAEADAEGPCDLLVPGALRRARGAGSGSGVLALAAARCRHRAAGRPAPTAPRTTATGRGPDLAGGPATGARRRTPGAREGRRGWSR